MLGAPFVFPVLVSAIAAVPVPQDRNHQVIITTLLFLTPRNQLAAQSGWFYDLNVSGIWPLLSAAHSSFCLDAVMALVLAASFPHHSSLPPPHFSSYDLDDIISWLTSQEESLLRTAWSAGSSSWFQVYQYMVQGPVWFTMGGQRQIGSNHWETSLDMLSCFPIFVLILFIEM